MGVLCDRLVSSALRVIARGLKLCIVISIADMAIYGPDGARTLHIINGNLVWRSKDPERKR